MKITFICDYFFPHSPGGAEQSAFILAKELVQRGIDISIITPNYGSKQYEKKQKIKIYRFPFIKLKKGKTKISPIFHTNFFWILYSAFQIYKISKTIKPNLIHIHGKFSLPGALIASRLLKIKTTVTIRDYRVLCPIGYCLFNKNQVNGFFKFLTKEIPFGIKHYLETKNTVSMLIYSLVNIRGFFAMKVFKITANLIDKKIFVSQKVKQIYNQNGINGGEVIYNLSSPPSSSPPLRLGSEPKRENQILYVGKLSYGKGIDLFLKTIKQLETKIPQYRFLIIGNSRLKKYQWIAKRLKLKNVRFLGQVPHHEIDKYYQKAKLVVIPSRWQEPLSRVTLEALSFGVPVVTTKKGGQDEIVESNKNGYLTEAKVKSLKSAILKGIDKNKTLRANIKKHRGKFKEKFYNQVINQHLKLYKNLIK